MGLTEQLPQAFLTRMQAMLGEGYEAFLASYDRPRHPALRVNTVKSGTEEFVQKSPFTLRPVPWVQEGFYYGAEERPGKHPYHEAGVYYIQEPSAMAVAALSGAEPGERVLDLCAAPGGKSTQLAAMLQGRGLLVSNEINAARAKILSQNIERMGIRNAVVTSEPPERLLSRFPAFFDRIVVDAPCSGEGMFRKEEAAIPNWSLENVELCARRQDDILDCAAQMLAPGGTLVYSTCTFAPAENEGSIARFLLRHPQFAVVDQRERLGERFETWGLAGGHPDWADPEGRESFPDEILSQLSGTVRLWPDRLDGEGHFLAVLIHSGTHMQKKSRGRVKGPDRAGEKLWQEFAAQTLTAVPGGELLAFGQELYLLPCALPLEGLRVLRPGLQLGSVRKNRFEPSHALALALSPGEVRAHVDLPADSPQARAFLRGESLPGELAPQGMKKGWVLICVDGWSLGWSKLAGGTLKNHYPKGLRKT